LSNLLKEKCALAKLREELEERKKKLCKSCKKFRYLARIKEEKRRGQSFPKISLRC